MVYFSKSPISVSIWKIGRCAVKQLDCKLCTSRSVHLIYTSAPYYHCDEKCVLEFREVFILSSLRLPGRWRSGIGRGSAIVRVGRSGLRLAPHPSTRAFRDRKRKGNDKDGMVISGSASELLIPDGRPIDRPVTPFGFVAAFEPLVERQRCPPGTPHPPPCDSLRLFYYLFGTVLSKRVFEVALPLSAQVRSISTRPGTVVRLEYAIGF